MQTARRVCVRRKNRPAHMSLRHPTLMLTANLNRSPDNALPTTPLPEEAARSPLETRANGSVIGMEWLQQYSINLGSPPLGAAQPVAATSPNLKMPDDDHPPNSEMHHISNLTHTGSPVDAAATSSSDWADWTHGTGAISFPSDPPQQPTGGTDCTHWFYRDVLSAAEKDSTIAKLDDDQECLVWDIRAGGTVVGDNFPAWLQREEEEYSDVLWLSPDSSAYFDKTVRPALEQRVLVFLSVSLGCVAAGTDTKLPLGQCTTTGRGGRRHYPQVTVKCAAFSLLSTTVIQKAMRNSFYIAITVNPDTIALLNHALQAGGTVIGEVPDEVQLAYRKTFEKAYETKHKRASPVGPTKGFLEMIKHGYPDVIGVAIVAAHVSCMETGGFSSGADLWGTAVPARNGTFRVAGSKEYKLAFSAFKKAFPSFFKLQFEHFIAFRANHFY